MKTTYTIRLYGRNPSYVRELRVVGMQEALQAASAFAKAYPGTRTLVDVRHAFYRFKVSAEGGFTARARFPARA